MPVSEREVVPVETAKEPGAGPEQEDWWGLFHLYAFASLTTADRQIERRELVWIKRFLQQKGREGLEAKLHELVEREPDPQAIERLTARAAEELPTPEKRRFVFNMAQLCKSKGSISSAEYENILDIATRLGIADTEADAIINSVFSINDTFAAIVGLLALGFILFATRSVIVPLIIALFITMIINRVESLLTEVLRLRRIRWLNKLFAMAVIVLAMFGLVMAAVSSGKDIAKRVPYYQQKIGSGIEGLYATAKARGIPVPDNTELAKKLQELPIGKTLGNFFSSLLGVLGNFFLVVVFTGFMVFAGIEYRGILQEMNDKISAYITIKTLMSIVTGVAVAALCWGFGVDFALFWAVLAVLLNYIPSVGAIIATAPPILIAFVQLESTASAVGFSLAMVAMQVLLGQVVEPKLMGDKLAVKPVAILLGLIFWGFLWGIPGMFLAAPLMALLRILASYFNFSRSFERLLAAD